MIEETPPSPLQHHDNLFDPDPLPNGPTPEELLREFVQKSLREGTEIPEMMNWIPREQLIEMYGPKDGLNTPEGS